MKRSHPTYLLLFLLGLCLALPMNALHAGEAHSDDLKAHPSCPICGMDRHKFGHSRVLIEYDDGSRFGACSLHCAALDMAYHLDKGPVRIQVGDYDSRELIDAETAVWVMGGKQMGVMTKNPKWAFGDKGRAEAFIAAQGGSLTDLETAMKAAYTDMYADTRMIREKRKMKRAKMGQMKKGQKMPHAHGSESSAGSHDN